MLRACFLPPLPRSLFSLVPRSWLMFFCRSFFSISLPVGIARRTSRYSVGFLSRSFVDAATGCFVLLVLLFFHSNISKYRRVCFDQDLVLFSRMQLFLKTVAECSSLQCVFLEPHIFGLFVCFLHLSSFCFSVVFSSI